MARNENGCSLSKSPRLLQQRGLKGNPVSHAHHHERFMNVVF